MLVMRLKNRQGFYRHPPPLSLSFTATLAAREKQARFEYIARQVKKSAWYYTILLEHFHVNHNLKANKMLTVLQMNRYLPWAQHPPPPIPSIHIHTSVTMINGTQIKKNPHFVDKRTWSQLVFLFHYFHRVQICNT